MFFAFSVYFIAYVWVSFWSILVYYVFLDVGLGTSTAARPPRGPGGHTADPDDQQLWVDVLLGCALPPRPLPRRPLPSPAASLGVAPPPPRVGCLLPPPLRSVHFRRRVVRDASPRETVPQVCPLACQRSNSPGGRNGLATVPFPVVANRPRRLPPNGRIPWSTCSPPTMGAASTADGLPLTLPHSLPGQTSHCLPQAVAPFGCANEKPGGWAVSDPPPHCTKGTTRGQIGVGGHVTHRASA